MVYIWYGHTKRPYQIPYIWYGICSPLYIRGHTIPNRCTHTKCLYQMKQNNIKYTHDRLQQEVFQHIYNTYPETRGNFWHTPNEFIPDTFIQQQVKRVCGDKIPNFLVQIFELHKKNFVSSLSKRKSIGVLAGVTDITGYWRGCLLMLDIKLPGDTLSEAQLRFIKANELQGGKFIEVNTLEQAIKDLADFFNPQQLFNIR